MPRAIGIARTALQRAVDRALRFDRDVGPERNLGRHRAVEDRRAHALRITAHVVLRDARPIGNAVEIQLAR